MDVKEKMPPLVAKPIVKNQLWIVTDGQRKVGNVEVAGEGYSLTLSGKKGTFASTKAIEKVLPIEFQRPPKPSDPVIPYAAWPTGGKTYNNMWDVKRKLHLFTKSRKSKCYHAAGWFNMKLNGTWQMIFCPKYIFVQRYEYTGPYSTAEGASTK